MSNSYSGTGMWNFVGWLFVLLFTVLWVANGLLMLISPRAWFRLPRWLGVHGAMTEAKYGTGWGAVETRVLGAIFVAAPIWIVCDMLVPRILHVRNGSNWILVPALIAILIMALNSLAMLISPQMWRRMPRWLRVDNVWFGAAHAKGGADIPVRVTGALVLAMLLGIVYAVPALRDFSHAALLEFFK